jgi:hypothetical protein
MPKRALLNYSDPDTAQSLVERFESVLFDRNPEIRDLLEKVEELGATIREHGRHISRQWDSDLKVKGWTPSTGNLPSLTPLPDSEWSAAAESNIGQKKEADKMLRTLWKRLAVHYSRVADAAKVLVTVAAHFKCDGTVFANVQRHFRETARAFALGDLENIPEPKDVNGSYPLDVLRARLAELRVNIARPTGSTQSPVTRKGVRAMKVQQAMDLLERFRHANPRAKKDDHVTRIMAEMRCVRSTAYQLLADGEELRKKSRRVSEGEGWDAGLTKRRKRGT